MAEERIYITTFEKDFECPIEEYCTDFHKQCKNCDAFPTRTEAIEKMAKAISKAFLDDKGNSQGATDKELAEAALNALLGKEND